MSEYINKDDDGNVIERRLEGRKVQANGTVYVGTNLVDDVVDVTVEVDTNEE